MPHGRAHQNLASSPSVPSDPGRATDSQSHSAEAHDRVGEGPPQQSGLLARFDWCGDVVGVGPPACRVASALDAFYGRELHHAEANVFFPICRGLWRYWQHVEESPTASNLALLPVTSCSIWPRSLFCSPAPEVSLLGASFLETGLSGAPLCPGGEPRGVAHIDVGLCSSNHLARSGSIFSGQGVPVSLFV